MIILYRPKNINFLKKNCSRTILSYPRNVKYYLRILFVLRITGPIP